MTRSWAKLPAALRRPEPFQPSDAPFWSDDYIATRLLIAHLDQTDDAASRPLADLDRCVDALTCAAATITDIVTRAQFVIEPLWSTLAGEAHADRSPWLAVVARKPT
ncbi:MAG TPA: hypothetical protein VIT41_02625 [Microlunatus sp.]